MNRGSFSSVGQGDNKGDNKGKEGGMGMRGMMGGLISVTGGEGRETMVGSGLHSVDLGSLVDGVVVESGIATPSGLPSPAGSFLFSRNRKANSNSNNNSNNNNNNNANRPGGGGEVAATPTPAIAESYPSYPTSQASLEMLEGKVAMQALLSATTVCLPEGGYLLPLIACQVSFYDITFCDTILVVTYSLCDILFPHFNFFSHFFKFSIRLFSFVHSPNLSSLFNPPLFPISTLLSSFYQLSHLSVAYSRVCWWGC